MGPVDRRAWWAGKVGMASRAHMVNSKKKQALMGYVRLSDKGASHGGRRSGGERIAFFDCKIQGAPGPPKLPQPVIPPMCRLGFALVCFWKISKYLNI